MHRLAAGWGEVAAEYAKTLFDELDELDELDHTPSDRARLDR